MLRTRHKSWFAAATADMFITSEHQPLGFGGCSQWARETVVVALGGTNSVNHSKRLPSRITTLEVPWSLTFSPRCSPTPMSESSEPLSSCRREMADRLGRLKAGASRPRATRGYGLDSAQSISATPTERSSHCADC